MADTANVLSITDQKNPTPQVPGQVSFEAPQQQPGNSTSPKPSIPSQNAPNVNGLDASFSASTSTLMDMVNTFKAKLSADSDALIANNKVDTTAAAQVSKLTDDTLDAMGRVKRIKQFPDEITQVLGIFDKDWNPGYQAARIDINQTKAAQVSATAAAIKNTNNQLPELMAKASAASKAIFDAQVEANKLYISGEHEKTDRMQAKVAQIHASIAMSQEARTAAEFNVNRMTTAQMDAAMADINAKGAKSKFAGMGGFIEHRRTAENAAITALDDARGALQDKNIDRFNKSMTNAASLMPAGALAPMIDKAEAAGQAVVNIPTGHKGPDGKDLTIPMPIRLAKEGLVVGMKSDMAANEMVSADLTQKSNIIPRITYLTNTAQSFISMDPRAANVFAHAAEIVKGINSKDPSSVGRVDALLKQQEDAMTTIVKENADKFSDPQARAAIIVAGKNGGKIDAVGGTAIATDSVGIPALNTGARYSAAWGMVNTLVAQEISKQGLGFGTVNNAADAQSSLAMMLAKPGGREKINAIAKNIFADPQKMAPIRDAIKEKITDSALGNTFVQLAQEKNANPVWGNLAKAFHENGLAQFHTPKGALDTAKLFESMEQATLLARAHGNKAADYSTTFIQGLQRYGATAQDHGASDPTYTISDRGMEAGLFNGDPTPTVMSGMAFSMRQVQARVKSEFQKRIQEDLNGTTQTNAYNDLMGIGAMGVPNANEIYTGDPKQTNDVLKKTGKNLNAIPSATGTGLTVSQVQQIMSMGQ